MSLTTIKHCSCNCNLTKSMCYSPFCACSMHEDEHCFGVCCVAINKNIKEKITCTFIQIRKMKRLFSKPFYHSRQQITTWYNDPPPVQTRWPLFKSGLHAWMVNPPFKWKLLFIIVYYILITFSLITNINIVTCIEIFFVREIMFWLAPIACTVSDNASYNSWKMAGVMT